MAGLSVGVVGLGKMGTALAYRLQTAEICVGGYDPCVLVQEKMNLDGYRIFKSLGELAQWAEVIWVMVPAGEPVDLVIKEVAEHARSSTVVVDGGNSHFTDSRRRAEFLGSHGMEFLDCGTSGGLQGREHGFCLMIGGKHETYMRLENIFKAIAFPAGFAHVGPVGAGHYVKMIHNGIEYGLLQAYAEGFQLLKEGAYPDLDLAQISLLWQSGSVIRSWILHLASEIFQKDQNLVDVQGVIGENGTGAWTLKEAQVRNVPADILKAALEARARSRTIGGSSYSTKVVAMLRKQFGGHPIQLKEDKAP